MSPLILDDDGLPRKPNPTRFRITPAKPTDVRRLVDIEFHAFENERVNQLLSYRDYKKPSHFQRTLRLYHHALLHQPPTDRLPTDPTSTPAFFKKTTDLQTNEITSFTKYEWKTYSPSDLATPLDAGHEGEAQMNRDWFALNERLRREYMHTTPHCYISMLATEPRHQHKGAGTLLLRHILAEADDAGVPVYLEATDTAKPLYARHGFEEVRELRFEPMAYGVRVGFERQTVMVRRGG